MPYREDMERCLEYIKAHPDTDAHALADMLGYSFFHFCHVFRSIIGVGAGEYLRRSRLELSAARLLKGARATDEALECGFDTPSGYTRAFRRRFGMSPSEYKKTKGGRTEMTPVFKKLDKFQAIGYAFKPDSAPDLKAGAFWADMKFTSIDKDEYAKLCQPNNGEIGTWMHPDEGGDLFYFFGPIVKDDRPVPSGAEKVEIPAAEYAVFEIPAAADPAALKENIQKTWRYIFSEWLDSSDWKFDQTKADFEFYLDSGSYIYIPVVKK